MAKNEKVKVQDLTEKLLSLVGVKAEVSVVEGKEEGEKTERIQINTEKESGLLIGTRGATLNAIQSFLALALRQETGEWSRVIVDVGDWRQKHEDYLRDLATSAAQRARSTGEPQNLYNLTASQRRVIHMALTKEEGVVSESQGEGENRYLIVKPA